MNFNRRNTISLTTEEIELLEKAYYVIVDIQTYLEETHTFTLTHNLDEISDDDLDFINEKLNLLFNGYVWKVE